MRLIFLEHSGSMAAGLLLRQLQFKNHMDEYFSEEDPLQQDELQETANDLKVSGEDDIVVSLIQGESLSENIPKTGNTSMSTQLQTFSFLDGRHKLIYVWTF